MIKIKNGFISNKIFYILLFMIGLNFFRKGSILIIMGIAVYLFINRREMDKYAILLALTSTAMFVFGVFNGEKDIFRLLIKSYLYFGFYCLGNTLFTNIKNYPKSYEHVLLASILAFSFGNFMHFCLDIFSNDNLYLISQNARVLTDFWTKGDAGVTILSGWCVPLVFIQYYAIAYKTEKLFTRVFISAMSILSFGLNIIIGARTYIVIFFISFILLYVFDCLFIQKNIRRILGTTGLLIGLVAIGIILFCINYRGIQDIFYNSTLYSRIASGELASGIFSDNGRMNRMMFMFNNFDKVLLGGSYCQNNGRQVHMWILQVIDEYGIFVAFCLFTLIVIIIKDLIRLIRSRLISGGMKILCVSIILSWMLLAFVEPLLTSNNVIAAFIFFYYGFIRLTLKFITEKRYEREY